MTPITNRLIAAWKKTCQARTTLAAVDGQSLPGLLRAMGHEQTIAGMRAELMTLVEAALSLQDAAAHVACGNQLGVDLA